MNRIKVPEYAREAARRGLEERKMNKAGLTKSEAQKLGINSGVERAKQLVRSKTISVADAKRIGAFYDRFKNQDSARSETALRLWGGRRFGMRLANEY